MSIAFRQIDERWKDYFEKFWSLTNDRQDAICYSSSQTISNRSCYNKHFSLFSLAPKMSHSSRCLGRIWTLIDWAWRFELVYWNDSIARAPRRAPAVAAIIKVKCKCLTIMMLLTFFCPNVNLVCAIKAQPIKCLVTRAQDDTSRWFTIQWFTPKSEIAKLMTQSMPLKVRNDPSSHSPNPLSEISRKKPKFTWHFRE